MPTRITRSFSRKGLFGGRVRYTTSRVVGKKAAPRVQVHLTGRDLIEMERIKQEQRDARAAKWEAMRQNYLAQRAARLERIGPQVAQLRQDAEASHAARMSSLSGAARWLHTRPGAIIGLALYGVALIVAITGFVWLAVAVSVMLAVVDWHNLSTLHGRIAWRAYFLEQPAVAGSVALLLAVFSFVPTVWCLVQNIRLGPTVADAQRAHVQAEIARLESELHSEHATTD